MTKVTIWPRPTEQPANHGIGRVVHAQYKYLPRYGVTLVDSESDAEVVAAHTHQHHYSRVDALHLHGLYWLGDKGSGEYTKWHSDANQKIIASARRARVLTVPSDWVGMPFKRDMRLSPVIIGHGIEIDEWTPGTNAGYVLWNKNRPSDVCDPKPAWEIAMQNVPVVSTFSPEGLALPGNMRVTGALNHAEMRELVRNADIYLATVKETFGIGTLEAMACGVPVLGYRHGGTSDIVRHEVDGYLAEPNNLEDLRRGLEWIRIRRSDLSRNARQRALEFTWERVCQQYAELYTRCAHDAQTEATGVSVIVSAYNYGRYISECIESLLAQSYKIDEIIVVDDGSTDDTARIVSRYKAQGVRYIHQTNQGVAYARNHGISLTTQPYIICLDADDKLHPRYVEVCRAEMLRDRGLGIAYTGLLVFNDADARGQRTGWPPEFDWEAQSTPHVPPSNCIPSAAMFRRSMWERAGGYKQEYKPAEDTEFWTRGISVGFTAKRVTDSPWFIYRSHPGSASRTNKYRGIDDYLPFMRDKDYPLAAPSREPSRPRSYSDPKVSVIIPVGPGHARYLPQALDSLVGQTMRDWQAVIVNDSGGDLPLKSYPFVRVIDIGQDRGAGDARNEGVHFADAPLVFFLDADDYLHPQALARLCKAYAKSGGRYVYGDWVSAHGDALTPMRSPDYNANAWVDFSHLDGKHIVSVLMSTTDARRVMFDTALPFWEDWEFFAHCAVEGVHGARIAEQTVVVRRNTGTRTKEAFSENGNAGPILTLLRERYRKGLLDMPEQCCGGNGAAILAARAAWDGTAPDTGGLTLNITTRQGRLNGDNMIIQGAPETGVTPVRLEFVGERQGAVTYNGKDGRSYRGGNNPLERYANVHPDDVGKLTSTGDWRVVNQVILPDVPDTRRQPSDEIPRQARNYTTGAPEDVAKDEELEIVEEKVVETGAGRLTRKRVSSRKEKESVLRDLPEQE